MIPFSPPRIDDKIIEEVNAALRSGWITTGPRTKELENYITDYCDHKRTLAVSSGTAGLELVLRWFGIGPGDEVIVPVYTYCATANVVMHCGATPVFVDVNADDFNISVNKIRKAITSKTKVIMPVDLAGMPCDYDEINQLVEEPEIVQQFKPSCIVQEKMGRILVLADAAHSIGAVYKGKRAGTLTDMTVFSFHAVKNLTTAEGGAICFNFPGNEFDCHALYDYFNIISLHGQTKDALTKLQKGCWEYDVMEPGYKANMTDVLAAIGLVEIKRYDETLEKRKEIFRLYDELIGRKNWAQKPVYKTSDKTSSCHVYLLRIKGINKEKRNKIIEEIFQNEVSVNVHFKPITELSAYKFIKKGGKDFPVAYDNYSREISLPVYYDLNSKDQMCVINAVIKSVEKHL